MVNLPEDCGVNGIDDLLDAWGPTKVLELFEQSVSGGRIHVIVPPQFESRPEGLFRVTTKGAGLAQVQLTNFQARIVTNVRLDDGIESKREFEIEAELNGQTLSIHSAGLRVRSHELANRPSRFCRDRVSPST